MLRLKTVRLPSMAVGEHSNGSWNIPVFTFQLSPLPRILLKQNVSLPFELNPLNHYCGFNFLRALAQARLRCNLRPQVSQQVHIFRSDSDALSMNRKLVPTISELS